MASKQLMDKKPPRRAAEPSPAGSFTVLIDQLFGQLDQSFERAGWSVQRDAPGGPAGYAADFLIRKGRLRYVAELRVARVARRPELPALFADAFLRAKAGAAAHKAQPLAIVGAPVISPAWSRALADQAQRFFPGEAWGFLDGAGRLELHGKGLEEIQQSAVFKPRGRAGAGPRPDLFSDLGQWMSKVLLAPSVPPQYLDAPRERSAGPRQLAGFANVSVPSASRFLSRLRALGFLGETDGLAIVQRERFLAEWVRASRWIGVERPCRLLFPAANPLEVLGRALKKRSDGRGHPRACLGLFAACEQLGLGFVRGAPVHLYAERPSSALLESLDLVPAAAGERVDVFVREPVFPEALFRGMVLAGQVPVADVLQCWLDVGNHPVRGVEQAEHLWKRVIQPNLLGSGELRR